MRKKFFKLYADACIEQDFVNHLRNDLNLDVKSASEENLQGKPDEKILKRANETRRFLLTYNKKDFFTNHKRFPFKDLFGIICLKFHKIWCPHPQLLCLARNDKQSLIGKKLLVSHDRVSIRYKGEDGKVTQKTLYLKNCNLCKLEEAK